MKQTDTRDTGPLPAHAGAALDEAHVIDTREGLALRASRCKDCGEASFPASSICPFCLSASLEPLPLRGGARLYAHTRVHVAPSRWETPYAIGYADFPCGLRLLAKLSDPRAQWRADQDVTLRVEPTGDGRYRYHLEGADA